MILKNLGTLLLVDGLSTLVFGRAYARLYRFGPPYSLYRRGMEWLLRWPPWVLRAAGAAEAFLGLSLLRREPLSVPDLYRKVAGGYAAIDPGWRSWFYPEAHQAFDLTLAGRLPEGGHVLDLGCGVGANLSRLIGMNLPFGSYTGVDLTPAMLEHARERYGQRPDVSFQQLDLMSDTLPEGTFDLIVSTWVFEHLPDPIYVAQKAWQNLKPGGHMILLFESEARSLTSRFMGWFYPFLSAHLLSEDEIRRLPGEQSAQHFKGPLGEVTVITLSRPLTDGPQ